MSKELELLIVKLRSLADHRQAKLAARFLRELEEEQGDGSSLEAELDQKVTFADIEHLVGSIKGGPSDVATNPKYMEGFGAKSMGRDH